MHLQTKLLGTIFALVALMGTVACSRTGESWKFHVSQDERDRVTQAEQEVLDKNFPLKAEHDDLQAKQSEARNQHGPSSNQFADATQAYNAFYREKLRPEVEKNDPSLKMLYTRIDLEQSNRRSDGFIEFAQEHAVLKAPWGLIIELLTFAVFFYGIYLLFRPPSLGSANLLLAFTLLPSTLLGLAVMGDMIRWFDSRQSGIYDFPMSTGEALTSFEALICKTYEFAVPSLLLYLTLLIRLTVKKRVSPPEDQ